jgi:hypothetical protein
MKKYLLVASLLAVSLSAAAKLPAPSEEAKAKAAEAAAKTAHGNKVADYQLCKSREKVAAHYYKRRAKARPHPQPHLLVPTLALTSLQNKRLLHRQRPRLLPASLPLLPPKKADRLSARYKKSPVGNGGGLLR